MDDWTKDLVQATAWLVASIGGLIAAWKAINELKRANVERAEALKERRDNFRWRQAEMAKTVLDELWSDHSARCAMKMLDWTGLTYMHDGRRTGAITHQVMQDALRTADTTITEDELFIRDCFDQLFDGFERIEHHLRIELVNWEDVEGRLKYYANLLANRKLTVESFLRGYNFVLASDFLNRFATWQAKAPSHVRSGADGNHVCVPDTGENGSL